ncbi:helix-turn-helix transcriptional regulator [Azospirillum doebereinerae]|uniref:helix-turn-helix transcriptional regulator n=1 Tax=Azospirillum doebereinerae TaxID=92933 RepID=UPI001EE5B05F|nr:AlpA family phage regulatory protein [Azospirillum doebereinerae]MCG5238672.1 AlpA family phage regulatory protein [Azospirillum doebereinerae]
MRFLLIDEVLAVVPVSKATLYRMINRKEFPPPCRIGASSMWPASDLREWANGVKRKRLFNDAEDFI